MNDLKWLNDVVGITRCANCGSGYKREDVSVVGTRDDYYFLRCVCHACGVYGVGVVFYREAGVPAAKAYTTFRCAGCGKLSRAGSSGRPTDASCPCYRSPQWVKGEWRAVGEQSDNDDPALGVDDVLTAHETLRTYEGDAHGLFKRDSR